jgi:hypothetical protein
MVKTFFIGAVLFALAAPLAAQSLADVARAEEARRKSVKGQGKVYTNDTLRGPDGAEPAAPPPEAAPAAATPEAATSDKPAATPGAKPPAPRAGEPVRDEKYWRGRLAGARDALSRSQNFADALQSQINALYTEFVNMDDPIQRSLIEKKRLASIAEQDRVKADITRQTKAIADIEDEARRANVPAGWLR